MAVSFVPRTVFPISQSLPKSYFLGHHKAGLNEMKKILSSTHLIIECRDYRIPLTSRNPLLEASLGGKERLIVYTKKDLGITSPNAESDTNERVICNWHSPTPVIFASKNRNHGSILRHAKGFASDAASLTGSRMMVVGMPNVGKSTLINSLIRASLGKNKVAKTGGQPGVTRKIATPVKLINETESHGSVYLLDTPGVFIPFVPDSEAMLKLALCGTVKDSIIPPTTLADYCLFHMNLKDPRLYSKYHQPTNDVGLLLEAIAQKTGRMGKGGIVDLEAAAVWMIQRWRDGDMGRFMLDDVSKDSLEKMKQQEAMATPSLSQARKAGKEAARARAKLKMSSSSA